MKKLTILSLMVLVPACQHKDARRDQIYEIMNFVIIDQELDKAHGLELEPEERYSLDKGDEEFLSDLIETKRAAVTPTDTSKLGLFTILSYNYEFGQLTKCLTQEDVDFMLEERIDNRDFSWDNSKLGFDLNNKDNWYVLSVPLVSKDGTKAVMMIRNLCTGLCGTGWTLLLIKKDGRWTSERGEQWLH